MSEELKIIITAEVQKAVTALKSAQDEVKEAGKEAKEAGKEAKDAGKKANDAGTEAEKGSKKAKDGANKWEKALKTLKKALTAVVAALGTKKIVEWTQSLLDATDAIDKGSNRLGLTYTEYQELGYAFAQCGSDLSNFKTGMKTFTETMTKATSGNKEATAAFKQLGVSVKDANGQIKPQGQLLRETLSAFQSMPDGVGKATLATQLFGKSGQDILPLLNSEAGSLDELIARAHQLGLVLEDETIIQGVKLGDTYSDVKQVFENCKYRIVQGLLPGFQLLGDWILEHSDDIEGFAENIGSALSSVIQYLVEKGPIIKEKFDAIKEAIKNALSWAKEHPLATTAIVVALAAVALACAPTTLSLGVLAAAAAFLVTNWDEITRAFNDWLAKNPKVKEALSKIKGLFKAAYQWVIDNPGLAALILGIAAAMVAFVAPGGGLVITLGLIAAAVYLAATNWDKITAAWDNFMQKHPVVKAALDGLVGVLQGCFGFLVDNPAIAGIILGVAGALALITLPASGATAAIALLGSGIALLISGWDDLKTKIEEFATSTLEKIKTWAASALKEIKKVFGIWDEADAKEAGRASSVHTNPNPDYQQERVAGETDLIPEFTEHGGKVGEHGMIPLPDNWREVAGRTDAISGAAATVTEAMREAAAKEREAASAIDAISGAAAQATQATQEYNSVMQDTETRMPQVRKATEGVARETEGAGKAIHAAKEEAQSYNTTINGTSSAVTKLGTNTKSIIDSTKTVVQKGLTGIKDIVGICKNATTDAGKTAQTTNASTEKSVSSLAATQDTLSIATAFLGSSYTKLGETTGTAMDDASTSVSTSTSDMTKALSLQGIAALLVAKTKYPAIGDTIETSFEDGVEGGENALGTLTDAGSITAKATETGMRAQSTKIQKTITAPFESAKATVSKLASDIMGIFKGKSVNSFSIKLPKFHITPEGWTVQDLLKGVIPKLSISWNAKGGVFDKPTLFAGNGGLQGIGEAGAEAVVPLEKNTKWLSRMAEMLSEELRGNTTVVMSVDGKAFGQVAINSINGITKQTGSIPLLIG